MTFAFEIFRISFTKLVLLMTVLVTFSLSNKKLLLKTKTKTIID